MRNFIKYVFRLLLKVKIFNKLPVIIFPYALDRTDFVIWFAGEDSYMLNCKYDDEKIKGIIKPEKSKHIIVMNKRFNLKM